MRLHDKPTLPPGWWDANVPADANPAEVVMYVEENMPTHPALPQLRQIRAGWERVRNAEPRQYRCPTCLDIGQIEKRRKDGKMGWQRCVGPKGTGCPYDAHKVAEAMKFRERTEGPRKREIAP